MLPWQLLPWHVDPAKSGGYDYGTDDPTYLDSIVQAQNYQSARVRALESHYRKKLCLVKTPRAQLTVPSRWLSAQAISI